MTFARWLKIAKVLRAVKANADRKGTVSPTVSDAPKRLVTVAASRRNRAARAIAVPMPNASPTASDVRKQVVEQIANRMNRAARAIVVPTEIVDPTVGDPMVNHLAMVIVVQKEKADVARCLGSSSCSTAITTVGSAKKNSIGSRKSSANWIATKTVS